MSRLSNQNQSRPKIVAVDGPAGSGKSSICAKVCRDIGWFYLNTGALYRAVAVLALKREASLSDSPELRALTAEFVSDVHWEHNTGRLFVGSEDLTDQLNSVAAGAGASLVAKMPYIRDALMPLQRSLSLTAPKGAMVDGRDIGTVIFPDADLKIFLTASLEERALRRLRQLESTAGSKAHSMNEIMESIALRDLQDSKRDAAPLKMAADAVLLDTSSLDVTQAVEKLKELLQRHGLIEA